MTAEHLIELVVAVDAASRCLSRALAVLESCMLDIRSISGSLSDGNAMRLFVALQGPKESVELAVRRLRKTVCVADARVVDEKNWMLRELALVKLSATGDPSELEAALSSLGARAALIRKDFLIAEAHGTPDKVSSALNAIRRSFDVLDLARSGIVAIPLLDHN